VDFCYQFSTVPLDLVSRLTSYIHNTCPHSTSGNGPPVLPAFLIISNEEFMMLGSEFHPQNWSPSWLLVE